MEGGPSPIAYAVPVFFVLIVLELWVLRRQRRASYRLADTLADIGTGILQQTVGVFTGGVGVVVYVALFERGRVTELAASSPLTWLLAVLLVDLAYYWFHRLSHQVNFLWAAHVVHHQSEDYHLAVALRQSAIQPLFSLWFYAPLALLGLPPLVTFTVVALNTLYQFWIHTELIGRMGPLEHILNTPSHHRVHHGRNPRYIDKNHAGSLIIWDKLFGTFEPEGEPLVYGITRPLRSWSVLWANVQPWQDLWRAARAAPRWRDKLRVWFAKPGWQAPGAPPPPDGHYVALDAPKFDPPVAGALRVYAAVQFVPALLVALVLLVRPRSHGLDGLDGALGAFVVVTMGSVGAWLEARPWVTSLEVARLVVSAAMLAEAVRRGLLPGALGLAGLAVVVASLVGMLYALRARADGPPQGISVDQGALR
jgi:sterol desaturase/sphingolipid hydroxylase (fatty acid hydroxylase superfamily)